MFLIWGQLINLVACILLNLMRPGDMDSSPSNTPTIRRNHIELDELTTDSEAEFEVRMLLLVVILSLSALAIFLGIPRHHHHVVST